MCCKVLKYCDHGNGGTTKIASKFQFCICCDKLGSSITDAVYIVQFVSPSHYKACSFMHKTKPLEMQLWPKFLPDKLLRFCTLQKLGPSSTFRERLPFPSACFYYKIFLKSPHSLIEFPWMYFHSSMNVSVPIVSIPSDFVCREMYGLAYLLWCLAALDWLQEAWLFFSLKHWGRNCRKLWRRLRLSEKGRYKYWQSEELIWIFNSIF